MGGIISLYSKQEMIKVAKLYYELGLTQKQIAEQLSYSRPTISRILEAAMKSGIVEVNIRYSLDSVDYLSKQLQQRFDLKKAFVAPVFVNKADLIMADVGKALANYLYDICQENDILGVSWGKTLTCVADHLQPKKVPSMQIVQLNGGVAQNSFATGSMTILEHFSKNFDADAHLLYAPTIVDSEEIAHVLMTDSNLQRVIALGKKANIAVFGIGRPSYDSVLYQAGYFKEDSYQTLLKKGAVGDICSRYYKIDGSLVDQNLNKRTIGLQLDELQQKEHAIAIAVGTEKAQAVLGALRGKFLSTLFVDEYLAKEIIHLDQAMK